MPNTICQSRCRRPDGIALVVTLSMLAIVALLAIAFVLTARTEVKSGSAYNDQAFAKSLAKMAVDRAAMEIYRQNKGNVISGGETAITSTNGAAQSIILIYSTNDFTKLDNYSTDTQLLHFGTDESGAIWAPYRSPTTGGGYDYVDRDGQAGRSTVEPYWIAVRDNNGILRGRFAYVALGNMVDLNAIGNINVWAPLNSDLKTQNAFYMRPADTNFGYGYIGNTNSAGTYTRGICPDISLPKFLLKLGYNSTTVNTSAYCIVAYRYGWVNGAYPAPFLSNPAPEHWPNGSPSAVDLNNDGVAGNPTDYRVYPNLPGADRAITALSQIYNLNNPIDHAATPGWDPIYATAPFTADTAGSNLSSYATVGLSADPNLSGVYVGPRVNLNAMTNGNAVNNAILSNSMTQLTNILWKFPQFTNNYNNNLPQVNNKIIQIALNLIDFHTTNRYPSVFTNGVNILTGVKATPYLNKVVISNVVGLLASLQTNPTVKLTLTSHIMNVTTFIASDVWNPYTSFPNTNMVILTNVVLKATVNNCTATLKFYGSPTNQSTNVIGPPILKGFTASSWTNLYKTNTVASGFVTNVFVGSNESVWASSANVSLTQIVNFVCLVGFTNNVTNLINRIYNMPVTNIVTYASSAWPALPSAAGLSLANTSITNTVLTNWVISLEADDPRMSLLYTNLSAITLGAMNKNTCFPTNYAAGALPPVASTNLDTWYREGTNSFFIKTNISQKVVANAYVSVGEIGYVHRGEPWATIRLQPFTTWATATVPATNYLYGEGKLLDYFRVNDLVDVAGRINLNSDTNGPAWIYAPGANANQSPALFALFSGITNSWYTNSLYAKVSAGWTALQATIDGANDDKITAIINELGNYRARMTNGAVNFTGQNNLLTYVGELCAISNLTQYTDDKGGTGIQQIPYTDDANREALIRAVANLVTTWQGGGTSTILAWGQAIKGGDTSNTNGVPGQIVKIQATFQVIGGKIQMTSYQYIP